MSDRDAHLEALRAALKPHMPSPAIEVLLKPLQAPSKEVGPAAERLEDVLEALLLVPLQEAAP